MKLLPDDERLFESIGDEIVAVLQLHQDRKRLSEMQSAQVAMAERRIVSTFVHDQLGQNLGYMQLKLDQLSTAESLQQSETIKTQLQHLREVANKSYEIVRDILKKIQPETIPHLTNLLQEHAKTVSRRARFELDFSSTGHLVVLPSNMQQLIFFTFREIISNVEKHAKADNVFVVVAWNEHCLDISVTDDGSGFELDHVDAAEHFGLEIMKERIAAVKAQLSIHSTTGSGTVVSLSLPLAAVTKVAYEH
ncbi:MAG: ATP-binding protein [Chloroflexota bacterium]